MGAFEVLQWYCWWLKSGVHQLRLVVYPIIYRVSAPSQVVVWDFSHQQYHSSGSSFWVNHPGFVCRCCQKIHSGKTNIAGKWTWIEDDFPIENRDIPASYLSLPEGKGEGNPSFGSMPQNIHVSHPIVNRYTMYRFDTQNELSSVQYDVEFYEVQRIHTSNWYIFDSYSVIYVLINMFPMYVSIESEISLPI